MKQDWKFQSIARDIIVKIEKLDKIKKWKFDKNLKNGQKLKIDKKKDKNWKLDKN